MVRSKPTPTVGASVLRASCNSKTRSRGGQRNTFGLMPGGTCPGATLGPQGCRGVLPGKKLVTCYVDPLMNAWPGVRSVLSHNTYLMKNAGPAEKRRLLRMEFQRFRETEQRSKRPWMVYRLHWSGDVFDRQYAAALRDVISEFPDLQFWNYTRSFWAVATLSQCENLAQYISLDPENLEEGLVTYRRWLARYNQYDNVQICWMAPDRGSFQQGVADLVANPSTASGLRKWLENVAGNILLKACPVDNKKMKLEHACAACGKCTGHRGKIQPIWFKT